MDWMGSLLESASLLCHLTFGIAKKSVFGAERKVGIYSAEQLKKTRFILLTFSSIFSLRLSFSISTLSFRRTVIPLYVDSPRIRGQVSLENHPHNRLLKNDFDIKNLDKSAELNCMCKPNSQYEVVADQSPNDHILSGADRRRCWYIINHIGIIQYKGAEYYVFDNEENKNKKTQFGQRIQSSILGGGAYLRDSLLERDAARLSWANLKQVRAGEICWG